MFHIFSYIIIINNIKLKMNIKFISLLFFYTLFTFSFALGPDGKCRALALRGGGTKGAYEVGALKAIVKHMDPIDY